MNAKIAFENDQMSAEFGNERCGDFIQTKHQYQSPE